jgi:Flp pilus assembly protein TadG
MTDRVRGLRGETGAVLIAGILLALALLMVIGAAVDIGQAFIVRRQLASLADQAALSGSQAINLDELHQGRLALDPELARTAALQSLLDSPGIEASASATPDAVRVEVQQAVPTILLRIVGLMELELAARATAAPQAP